eukprot:2119675-Alexandrium_andersonii.AAC.1
MSVGPAGPVSRPAVITHFGEGAPTQRSLPTGLTDDAAITERRELCFLRLTLAAEFADRALFARASKAPRDLAGL